MNQRSKLKLLILCLNQVPLMDLMEFHTVTKNGQKELV